MYAYFCQSVESKGSLEWVCDMSGVDDVLNECLLRTRTNASDLGELSSDPRTSENNWLVCAKIGNSSLLLADDCNVALFPNRDSLPGCTQYTRYDFQVIVDACKFVCAFFTPWSPRQALRTRPCRTQCAHMWSRVEVSTDARRGCGSPGDRVAGDWEHLAWVLENEPGPLKEQHAFSPASKLNS